MGFSLAPEVEWNKTFDRNLLNDISYSVWHTSDNGYILAGSTRSANNAESTVWIVKTDSNGNHLWNKTFNEDYFSSSSSLQQTSDGGYIVAGRIFLNSYDFWLIKTDASGNQQWNKTFDSGSDIAMSVKQTNDWGYITLGSLNDYDFWLIKTDASGNPQWNKTFDGGGEDFAHEVQITSDNGFILVGYTRSSGQGATDAWLIKTDSSGIPQWNKTFGGSNHDQAYSVQQTTDDGYILAGQTDSFGSGNADVWLIKTDSLGNHEWNRTFSNPGGINFGSSVKETSDGGYIIAGPANTIIKTDSNGNQEWSRTFYNDNFVITLKSIQLTNDGFIAGGFGASPQISTTDFWLIKINYNNTPTNTNDTTPPNMTVIHPINGSTITTNSTWLNVTTNESAVCRFQADGCPTNQPQLTECDEFATKNLSTTNGFSHLQNITNPKNNFTYDATLDCEDNSGNSNTKLVIFYVAFPQPGSSGGGGGSGGNTSNTFNLTITIHSPLNNSILNTSSVNLNISTDGYAICKYSLDETAYNFLDRKVTGFGDAWRVGTSTKILELSESLNSGSNTETLRNITTFIDNSELSNALASGTISNSKGDAPYNQYFYLLGLGTGVSSGYVIYAEDDNDVTADFLYFKSGQEIGRYLLEFTTALQSDVDDSTGTATVTGDYLTDFEGVKLTMLGKEYTIIQATRNGGKVDQINLALMEKAVSDTLLEGATKTYTVDGKDYEVTLGYVDSDSAKLAVNGQSIRDLLKGESDKLSDGIIVVISKILYQDYAGGVHSATFYLGKGKMELKDTNIKDAAPTNNLKVDDDPIDDAYVIIEGSDNNVTFKINRIRVNMTADDDFYVPAGGKLSQNPSLGQPAVLFTNNWDIEYKGLVEQPLEEIRIQTSGNKRYKLKFKDGDGNEVDLPLVEAVADSALEFGEKDKALINQENRTIAKDDYIIVTDSSQQRGKRKTYVLQYKGADKITADSPVIKFKNLGSGETIEQTYSQALSLDTGTGDVGGYLATLKIGGADFRVYNASSIKSNDFSILMDQDASGSITTAQKIAGSSSTNYNPINITTGYGAEIGILNTSMTNVSNGVIVSFKTPDNSREGSTSLDNVETLQATDFVVNITSDSNSKVAFTTVSAYTSGQGGTAISTRTPDSEANITYAYTSYGAFITHSTPLNEPATLKIEYPKKQREALVYITTQKTENKYEKELNNLESGEHSIDIACKDSIGKTFSYYLKFTVANKLSVESNFPANGSVNVSVKESIKANFSHSIGKYSNKGVSVKDLTGENVKGILFYNSTIKQLVFDPILLKYNATYIVTINKNIKGLADNTLEQDYAWNFTTALKDTDNDGIPDYDDNDLDNDGIDDNFDPLRGNLSNVNSDFINVSMRIEEDENISKLFNGTKKIKFYNGKKKLLEFDFDFSNNSMLDLTNVSILNTSNSSLGSLVVSGVDLSNLGFTKTAYMEKVDAGINGICIKDEEIEWIDNITDSCNGNNEFKIECDGSSQNGYICTYNSSSNLYAISGLKHSGAKQLDYTKPSSGDSSSNNGGGGGGGGGGSGLSYVCNMDWSCTSWSECENGWETRECSFVKVSQHTSSEICASIDNVPQRAKKCEVGQKQETSKTEISEAEEAKRRTGPNETKTNQITGMAVSEVKGEANKLLGILLVIAIVSLGSFFYYGFFNSKF